MLWISLYTVTVVLITVSIFSVAGGSGMSAAAVAAA